MCIDTLEITYRNRAGSQQSEDEEAGGRIGMGDRSRIDFDTAYESLVAAGYECSETALWRGGRGRSFDVYVAGRGRQVGLSIKGYVSDDDYCYIDQIVAHPMRYDRFEQFWDVLLTMDAGGHRPDTNLVLAGVIRRIDYTCDYKLPIQTVMEGLYIDRMQTVIAYADLDRPYMRYEWNRGTFSSYQVGQSPKVIKIYDKGAEEFRARQVAYNRRMAELQSTGGRINGIRQRPPIRTLAIKTRIEVMLTGARDIANRIWNENSRGAEYDVRLRELPDHLNDVRFGRCNPFKGILLNRVGYNFQGSDRAVTAQKARHEVEMGFLMNIFQRMGAERFWAEHARMFRLFPWMQKYQPTSVFREAVNKWMTSGQPGAKKIPRAHYDTTRITTRWPIQEFTDAGRRRTPPRTQGAS